MANENQASKEACNRHSGFPYFFEFSFFAFPGSLLVERGPRAPLLLSLFCLFLAGVQDSVQSLWRSLSHTRFLSFRGAPPLKLLRLLYIICFAHHLHAKKNQARGPPLKLTDWRWRLAQCTQAPCTYTLFKPLPKGNFQHHRSLVVSKSCITIHVPSSGIIPSPLPGRQWHLPPLLPSPPTPQPSVVAHIDTPPTSQSPQTA